VRSDDIKGRISKEQLINGHVKLLEGQIELMGKVGEIDEKYKNRTFDVMELVEELLQIIINLRSRVEKLEEEKGNQFGQSS
jgi:hypothetical protein